MLRSTRFRTIALVALAALAGYLAASTDLFRRTTAAVPPTPTLVTGTDSVPQACCADNVNKGELLALASHNQTVAAAAQKAGKKPTILIIWGDDIGYWNPSCYHRGMMGYKMPNIDRIAAEGALFADWYGQQSCTAGQACFITDQVGFRTGLLTVGLPGATEGLKPRDVTIAELLKAQGYITAQFGKRGWVVVNMKKEWKAIYPFQK